MKGTSMAAKLLVAALLGAVALIPLSGAGVAGSAGARAVSLCTRANQVTGVVVTRGHPLNPETFTFPRVTRSSDARDVRALARALCALPVMPRGVFCPVDWSPTYTLVFSAPGGVTVRPVVVGVTGCAGVSGLGSARWVDGHSSLFATLGAAIGLRHATAATFAGTRVAG